MPNSWSLAAKEGDRGTYSSDNSLTNKNANFPISTSQIIRLLLVADQFPSREQVVSE